MEINKKPPGYVELEQLEDHCGDCRSEFLKRCVIRGKSWGTVDPKRGWCPDFSKPRVMVSSAEPDL